LSFDARIAPTRRYNRRHGSPADPRGASL
jgi:hypothetical protein